MNEALSVVLRPRTLDEVVGQSHAVSLISTFLSEGFLPSMIFYGPPGTGKTTIARIIAEQYGAKIYHFSGVKDSVTTIKKYISSDNNSLFAQKRMIFVDELHRFNKAQQDVFLPIIEDDGVVFIGATTENPSFYVNDALLSRARVLRFESLATDDILLLLQRGIAQLHLDCSQELLDKIANSSFGDARIALSTLESAAAISNGKRITDADLQHFLAVQSRYDKKDGEHYRTISAFIKSLRGSDADAALYYLVKMLESGDDPLFIMRRMMIFASEDVGNADPHALMMAAAASQALERVGMPEGKIILSHLVTYLACAPKSNASYQALHRAEQFFKEHPNERVPSHLVNNSLRAPEEQSDNYLYPHDYPGHWVEQRYFPGTEPPPIFYEPSIIGYEKKIRDYQEALKKKKK